MHTDKTTRFLIIGAGISGLAFANYLDDADYLILERDAEIGGWCKTVEQDGFVWDYSGHFFHFRYPEIEAMLRARMAPDEVVTVARCSKILYGGVWIDFPFQKNIHQLPHAEFLECLHDLYFRDTFKHDSSASSFKGMLYEKFGKGIAEKFLIPYNEKLYACDLDKLDREAMGRFFPHADLADIIRNMRAADNSSYNATFTYPRHGAIMYVKALAQVVPAERLLLNTGLAKIDLRRRVATTTDGQTIQFEHLISSAPFDKLTRIAGLQADEEVFTYNKVLVFNLGFDRKGPTEPHWVYFPQRDVSFYRVGFYDNILRTDERMSLYVELGYPRDATPDAEAMLPRVLADLERTGIITDHKLIAYHSVVMDPAYVHITQSSRAQFAELSGVLALGGVHSIGRYGGWTYCSIEDNIVEARDLARRFNRIG
jgi:protoporphyrinogen oxidase